MFQWVVTILVVVAMAILFGGWSRSIGLKRWLTGIEADRDWKTYRVLVFVAFAFSVLLIIIALTGSGFTFAYFSAVYLVLFSVVFLYGVTLFQSGMRRGNGGGGVGSETSEHIHKLGQDMRSTLTAMHSDIEKLQSLAAEDVEGLKASATSILERFKKLSTILDDLK